MHAPGGLHAWEMSRAETRNNVAARQSCVKRMRGTMGNSEEPKTPTQSWRPEGPGKQIEVKSVICGYKL